MILSKEQTENLKELIFSEIDDDEFEFDCMDCVKDYNIKCKFFKACQKYGAFAFIDGATEMTRDLFETIEYLREMV